MLNQLEEYLRRLTPEGVALAFSGGVDSTLLLAVLCGLRQKIQFPFAVLTMRTVLQDKKEMLNAENLAANFGVIPTFFSFDPLTIDAVRHNRTDRCYHCKKAIFTEFRKYAVASGLKYLLDGTNADDLNVYRPGRKALQELEVVSPLAELGVTKSEIRKISAKLGLSTASKPAVPCLATRFEYNTLLDDAMLSRVSEGETVIKKMFPEIKDIRLRVHGRLARLEVSAEWLQQVSARGKSVAEALENLGFDYVTLDLSAFRSGSFDKGLKLKQN